MIDPASSWSEIVELSVAEYTTTIRNDAYNKTTEDKDAYFDKSFSMIYTLVDEETWFSRYPHCQQIVCENGSEFKFHFKALCD